jgi:MFS family permease
MKTEKNRFYKRNFVLGVINGSLINVGMAFLDPFTVLPVFIMKLGGSAALVGLVSALPGLGWFLPQVVTSRFAETRRYLMNMFRISTIPRVLGFAATAAIVFYGDISQPVFFMTAFVLALLFAYVFAGVAAVPLLEVVSKTIPATRRGAFFGTRRFIGGILGIFVGMVVGIVLDQQSERVWMGGRLFEVVESAVQKLGLVGHAFPADFGVIFLLGAVCMAAGTVIFCFAGEPPAATVEKASSFLDHLRYGASLLKREKNYRRFFLARVCWQFTAMAFPFYATYAYQELNFSTSTVGLFLSVWVGSGIFSNYVWGQLMDRKGNKIVLTLTAVLGALPPIAVLLIDGGLGEGTGGTVLLILMASTFAINGFIRSGRLISNITYLLEFAPETKRPLYVGFMNSLSAPFMLTPVIGGVIIQVLGIQTLFWLSMAFALLNILLSTRLEEPRDTKS